MSNAVFVEALSSDPFVKELHRRVVRLLNDPSLDRQQREFHVRKVQSLLLAHQARQAAKAQSLADKKLQRDQVSRHNRNQGVADPSQVLARRREFGQVATEATAPEAPAQDVVAANDNHMPERGTYRNRPVLTLKRA
jgi:hypothetical protein